MYSSEEWEVVWLSVQVGVLCVAISLPPAVFLGSAANRLLIGC